MNINLNLSDLILNKKKEGRFVAILQDENGSRLHAVGIDAGQRLICDCVKTNNILLNQKNLSTCCGDRRVFNSIQAPSELKKKIIIK